MDGGEPKIGKALGFHSISLILLPFGWFLGKYFVVHTPPPPILKPVEMPRAIVRFDGFLQDMSLICRDSRQLHDYGISGPFSTLGALLYTLKIKLQKQNFPWTLLFPIFFSNCELFQFFFSPFSSLFWSSCCSLLPSLFSHSHPPKKGTKKEEEDRRRRRRRRDLSKASLEILSSKPSSSSSSSCPKESTKTIHAQQKEKREESRKFRVGKHGAKVSKSNGEKDSFL